MPAPGRLVISSVSTSSTPTRARCGLRAPTFPRRPVSSSAMDGPTRHPHSARRASPRGTTGSCPIRLYTEASQMISASYLTSSGGTDRPRPPRLPARSLNSAARARSVRPTPHSRGVVFQGGTRAAQERRRAVDGSTAAGANWPTAGAGGLVQMGGGDHLERRPLCRLERRPHQTREVEDH